MTNEKLEIKENSIINKFLFLGEKDEQNDIKLPFQINLRTSILKPTEGCCIKIKNKNQEKLFVNICRTNIESGPSEDEEFMLSFGPVHKELDKSGEPADVYDIVIIEEDFLKCLDGKNINNAYVLKIFHNLEKEYHISISKKDWILLKNKKYFGNIEEQFGNVDLNEEKNPILIEEISEDKIIDADHMLVEKSSRKLVDNGKNSSGKSLQKKEPLTIKMKEKEENELQSLVPNIKKKNIVTLHPKPGMCVKTKSMKSGEKCFINICTSEIIPKPEDITDEELIEILESDEPTNFKVPMSIGEGHEEADKAGNACIAYDVIINPVFFDKMYDNPLFNNFFILVTIEGLNEKFEMELNRNDWHVIKNKDFYGSIRKQTVQTEIPLVQELSSVRHWDTELNQNVTRITAKEDAIQQTPKFLLHEVVKISTDKCYLKIVVELPLCSNGNAIMMKMSDESIVLDSPLYFLHISIPYKLNTNKSLNAHFLKDTKELIAYLPVLGI